MFLWMNKHSVRDHGYTMTRMNLMCWLVFLLLHLYAEMFTGRYPLWIGVGLPLKSEENNHYMIVYHYNYSLKSWTEEDSYFFFVMASLYGALYYWLNSVHSMSNTTYCPMLLLLLFSQHLFWSFVVVNKVVHILYWIDTL